MSYQLSKSSALHLFLACVALPVSLHAATIDTFSLDEGGGYIYRFSLPASPTAFDTSSSVAFTLSNVTVYDMHEGSSYTEQVGFGIAGASTQFIIGDSVEIDSKSTATYRYYPNGEPGNEYTYSTTVNKKKVSTQLFTGSTSSPTFIPGVYALKGVDENDTLTITQSMTMIPEASSAALVALALAGLTGMMRGRFQPSVLTAGVARTCGKESGYEIG